MGYSQAMWLWRGRRVSVGDELGCVGGGECVSNMASYQMARIGEERG